MFSYIFMKVLESRPSRYDRWIDLLSFGHSASTRKQIITDYIRPGISVLDIGCGTGSLLVDAAAVGAKGCGLDISENMLSEARKKIRGLAAEDRINLYNAGISEIDSLFETNSFDVVVSTLVFSELYAEERTFALHQISRVLKPDGKLIIAVEVTPKSPVKRLIHFLIRLPLALLTYVIAQTGTRPCNDLQAEISSLGFTVLSEKLSFLDSFLVLTAESSPDLPDGPLSLPRPIDSENDISISKTIWDFIGRWFPNPVEPGLRLIGNPNRNSPVIVTANFHLTVRRVERALHGENVFLLVAPSNGINVWCASCGGEFTSHSILSVLKTSRIAERIDHHRIILPQFSAPGIDRKLLKTETGLVAVFGPAYARDIPAYLKSAPSLYKHNQADFSFSFRMEMLLSMNFIIWMAAGAIASFSGLKALLNFSLAFWGAGFLLYAGYPLLPGNSGWLKALYLSAFEILLLILIQSLFPAELAESIWRPVLVILFLNMWFGFDLRGIVAGSQSEAEALLQKTGLKSLSHLYSATAVRTGLIHQDTQLCHNCRFCLMVCPKGVYALTPQNEVRIVEQDECFACGACVKQCDVNALTLL
ncbi:MAG: methyltransferase domain-containing protein [FCB group bacterium]|nr:methyltransferase domain-containing protein [FCB group bacterium]